MIPLSALLSRAGRFGGVQAGLAWLRTLRVDFGDSPRPGASGLLALWHEQLLLCLPAFTHLRLRALVSRSRDGAWAAALCRGLGYETARGSSSRGGAAALRSLARDLESRGGWAAVVVDGPQGPPRRCKPGVVWLARRTGLPITVVAGTASPSGRAGSWDGCVIPAPFARVRLRLAAPCRPETTDDLDALMAAHAAGRAAGPIRTGTTSNLRDT